jgi:hypothetical protein
MDVVGNLKATQSSSIAVRLQLMEFGDQALLLARLLQSRDTEQQFSVKALAALFLEIGLPPPAKLSNIVDALRQRRFATRGAANGTWKLAPLGRQRSFELMSDLDLAALAAESSMSSSVLAHVTHTVVPPALAPPALIPGLRRFIEYHPFERNVFGMTRFPDPLDPENDPVKPALEIARTVCNLHGLEFHLASDRMIHDDLWANVAAHMWGCQYGIAFFENRRDRGLNYNLSIEVGSMLMTGRRCALLKDTSVPKLPTDLVGQIHKSVDLTVPQGISNALHEWLRDDLTLGACPACPKT